MDVVEAQQAFGRAILLSALTTATFTAQSNSTSPFVTGENLGSSPPWEHLCLQSVHCQQKARGCLTLRARQGAPLKSGSTSDKGHPTDMQRHRELSRPQPQNIDHDSSKYIANDSDFIPTKDLYLHYLGCIDCKFLGRHTINGLEGNFFCGRVLGSTRYTTSICDGNNYHCAEFLREHVLEHQP